MYTVSMPAKNSPNHGFAKRAGFHSCRLFLLCIFFGLKPTCTISPQCLHFISSTTFPGGISSMSKMRRPHLGFGHFTFSIDHRLPALIFNKGTKHEIFLLGSLLSFVLYCSFSHENQPTHCSLNACQAPLCIHQTCISYPPPQSGTLPSSLLCRSPLSYQKRTFSCSGCSAPAYQPTA